MYRTVCSTEKREIRPPGQSQEQISPRVLTIKPVRLGFTARHASLLRHYVMTTNTATQAILARVSTLQRARTCQ